MVLLDGRRLDALERRTVLAIGGVALAAVASVVAVAVGTGNTQLLTLAGAPMIGAVLIAVGLRWPYVFPFGLYCVMTPFDQVLTIPGAGSVSRYLGLAAMLFTAAYAIRMRRIHRPPLAVYLWLGFFLWLALGMFRTTDAANGVATFQAMASLILMLVVFAVAPTSESQLRFVCAAVAAGGVVASIYGLVLFHQHPELLAKTDARVTVDVLGRTLDANLYADSLLAPFAFALVGLLHARTPVKLFVTFGSLAVIGAAIVASLSREALLACAVIVAVTIWFSRHRIAGFVFAIPAFALLPIAVPSILTRIQDAFLTGGAGRTSIWSVDWSAFLQHPVIGWGTGNSIDAYNLNYLRVFQAYNAGWGRPPHNTALFIGVEFGLIGIALFFGAWLAAFGPLRSVKRGDSLYDVRVAISASLLAILVASVFVDVSATKVLWLMLIVAAQYHTVTRTRAHPHAPATVVYEPAPVRPPSGGTRRATERNAAAARS